MLLLAACADASKVSVPEAASMAKQNGSYRSDPSHAEVSEGDMLRLDDELAGLIEAADMPAGQAGVHPTKPEPTSSVPGELAVALMVSAAVHNRFKAG